jgi:putative ABC transport system permease protein
MLSVAMVVAFGGLTRAIYLSVAEWLDTALNPDLFVSASEDLTNRTFTFPPETAAAIAQIPGVTQTQKVRSARVLFRGVPVMLVAVEVGKLSRTVHRTAIAGDMNAAYRLAAEGRAVLVSDSFAGLRGVKLGDVIELPTPGGMLKLPIAAITRDYSDQQGSVLVDRGVFLKWWKDDRVNIVRVYLGRGISAGAVKRAILSRFASERRLFVLSNAEVRRYILRLTDQWFGMTYNQIAVAILVAVLGIVNTLIVSITDRRRELGVLQAVGAFRRQIRHTVWMEALSIGAIGLVLGIAFGCVNLWYTLEMTRRDFAGMRLDYTFPFALAALLWPLILGAALAAAAGPAESAVRGSLVEALEYE